MRNATAYKLEVYVLDYNQVGHIEDTLRNASDDLHIEIIKNESREIKDWDDDHPLNKNDTWKQTYLNLFQ